MMNDDLKLLVESIISVAEKELDDITAKASQINIETVRITNSVLSAFASREKSEISNINQQTEQMRKELDDLANQAYYHQGRKDVCDQVLMLLRGECPAGDSNDHQVTG